MANRVMTAARARLFMNGMRMGYAAGVTVTENIQQEPVNVLDNVRPIEFATVGYSVTLRCQLYKLPNEDIVQAGLWPKHGRDPDELKTLLLSFEDLTADLYDSYKGAFIGKCYGVKPTSRSIQFSPRGLIITDASFLALGSSWPPSIVICWCTLGKNGEPSARCGGGNTVLTWRVQVLWVV
jgi:hypothetical protein